MGIRPEHLSRHDGAANGQATSYLTARVEVVEPTGAETMVIMRLGEQELVGRFAPALAPRMDETVTLAVDMKQACLFDAKTEKLIA